MRLVSKTNLAPPNWKGSKYSDSSMGSSRKQHGSFSLKLQPDYKFSHNGYGLLQLTANFKDDQAQAATSSTTFARGAMFPSKALGSLGKPLSAEAWTCIKAEESGSEGGVITITAHFAAIAKSLGGTNSQVEATLTSSAASDPIESHPNFSQILVPRISPEDPLGGELDAQGPPLNPADFGTKKNKFRAKWIPSPTAGLLSYQFVGFLPAQKQGDEFNRKAGIKNYFRPSVTLKLVGYTNNQEEAVKATNYVGFSTKNGVGFLKVPAPYDKFLDNELDVESAFEGDKDRNWLCTGSNLEVYGGLYKCSIDLMLSGIIGWDPNVYPAVE